MNLLWCWWYKHFHFVYIFASVLFLGLSGSSMISGDEPTEEPEESHVSSGAPTPTLSSISPSTIASFSDNNSTNNVSSGGIETVDGLLDNSSEKVIGSERREQQAARAFLHAPGKNWNWKTAGRMVSRGLRMFRESLLEGAKVAHMFKEDFDEGVSPIMRQNRGVKADSQSSQKQNDNSDSGSFFDSQMLREGVLGGILRFMGINSKQMGVIALNVLIILAEWITSSMIGGNEVAGATSRMIKSNLLQWANTGHNSQVEKILSQAKSHSLPEKLIDTLSENTGNSTSCVQLLICKMTPMIWGFQDTVKSQLNTFGFQEEPSFRTAPTTSSSTTSSPFENDTSAKSEPSFHTRGIFGTSRYLLEKFLGHLPPTGRMLDFGDRCEAKFPKCQLLKFGTTK